MKDLTIEAFRRLLFARLGPTLAALKLLSLGKVQINLAFRSLGANFSCAEVTFTRKSPNKFGFSLAYP